MLGWSWKMQNWVILLLPRAAKGTKGTKLLLPPSGNIPVKHLSVCHGIMRLFPGFKQWQATETQS